MKPIPFNALAKFLGLQSSNQVLVKGVAIDSRKVVSGDLFFALPGNRVNGEAFIQDAVLKGAVGAVVTENYQGESWGVPLLRVPSVLATLQDFARKSLAKSPSKVIAITGSLGKTTTKEFAKKLLCTHYRVFASPLSYNSQATVPLSILRADGTEDYLILEMGMTHSGNIENLISIAPPSISLLTTLSMQHVCNFTDGLIGISREKATIFTHPKTELGLLHHDIPHYAEVVKRGSCLKKTFSTAAKEADFFLEKIPDGVRIYTKGAASYEIPLDLPVNVHYQNFLAAVSLARSLDIPWPSIRDAASFLQLPAMRFERVLKKGITFINDAYNANPDSMKAALESLPPPQPGGRTIAVLSEMDALGAYAEEGHTLVAQAALEAADYLFCLGPLCETMRTIWQKANKPVQLFLTRQELEQSLIQHCKAGDVVLLKGARSHALDQILNAF